MGTTSNAINLMFEKVNHLFQTDLKKILTVEQHNANCINLYSVGEYWAAFEKSAYLLKQMIHDDAPPVILYVEQHPFPIVMHNVHSRHIDAMCRKHPMAARGIQYLQLQTQPVDDRSYKQWYREHVLAEEASAQ